MSTTLRRADLDKSVPISEVLNILDYLDEQVGDRIRMLESNDWTGTEYAPATPEQVWNNCLDQIKEFRDQLTSVIPL